jgi:hypothetical protein
MSKPEPKDNVAVNEHMKRLRELSGSFQSNDALTCFLYLLARDHLPTGVIEQLLMDATSAASDSVLYTNGYLAQYADYVAKQLSAPIGAKKLEEKAELEATSKALQENEIIDIKGKKYRRVSDEVFREFTKFDDYQILHPETRPDVFSWKIEASTVDTRRVQIRDWRGRALIAAEQQEDTVIDFGVPVHFGRGPQAAWYPDGKVFYFDGYVYEPVE